MNEKKYHINNEPASAKDIIEKARKLDKDFDFSRFWQTSIAANILRENGYKVGTVQEINNKISKAKV